MSIFLFTTTFISFIFLARLCILLSILTSILYMVRNMTVIDGSVQSIYLSGTSLVVQWLRPCLPVQQVRPLVGGAKIPHALAGAPELGESKWAKMACSGSLAPHFLKNDYVTAETIYNTACVHHEVLGHGLLCAVHPCKFHLEKPRKVVRGYVVLWLPHQPGENKLMCSSYGSSHFLPAS